MGNHRLGASEVRDYWSNELSFKGSCKFVVPSYYRASAHRRQGEGIGPITTEQDRHFNG